MHKCSVMVYTDNLFVVYAIHLTLQEVQPSGLPFKLIFSAFASSFVTSFVLICYWHWWP